MLTDNLINYYEALKNAGYYCVSKNSDIRGIMKNAKVISAHIDEISSCFTKGDNPVMIEEDNPTYGHVSHSVTFKGYIEADGSCHPTFVSNPPLGMKDWGVEEFLNKIKNIEAYPLKDRDRVVVFLHEGESFFAFKGTLMMKEDAGSTSTIATICQGFIDNDLPELS